jgi:hypothetical protein
MYNNLKKVILKHPKDAFISQEHLRNEWKKFNYINEPNYIKAQNEFEQFYAIIKNMSLKLNFYQLQRQLD